MEEEEYIPANLIKQYHFCPRIIYFTQVLGVSERQTESMVEGKEMHGELYRLEKRRKTVLGLKKEKVIKRWAGIHLKSKKLKLSGLVDMVVQTDKGYKVVEYKEAYARKKPPKSHLYQVAAYAMLVEENWRVPIKEILIYYSKSKKLFKYPLTDSLRDHVKWTVRRIMKIIDEEKLPNPTNTRRCKSCGYYWICRGI